MDCCLNEQVSSVTDTATVADEFILIHKKCFSMPAPCVTNVKSECRNWPPQFACKSTLPTAGESHKGFYCHEPDHLIAACPTLRKKEVQKLPHLFLRVLFYGWDNAGACDYLERYCKTITYSQ